MTQQTSTFEILKSPSDSTSRLIKKTSQSVVSVKAQMSQGTGVVLTSDGYIVTCNQVLAGCGSVKIGQGQKTLPVNIEPPSPMPAPPLRKRPTIKPQFAVAATEPSTAWLFFDALWN